MLKTSNTANWENEPPVLTCLDLVFQFCICIFADSTRLFSSLPQKTVLCPPTFISHPLGLKKRQRARNSSSLAVNFLGTAGSPPSSCCTSFALSNLRLMYSHGKIYYCKFTLGIFLPTKINTETWDYHLISGPSWSPIQFQKCSGSRKFLNSTSERFSKNVKVCFSKKEKFTFTCDNSKTVKS